MGWATKHVTGNTQVFTGRCNIHGFLVSTDGTNDVTVTIYDGTDTSGDKVTPPIKIKGTDNYGGVLEMNAICSTGAYATVNTAGTAEVVFYFTRD